LTIEGLRDVPRPFFVRDDPGPKQRKRTDDFDVVKFQRRTAMPIAYSRLFGEYAARASFALVTLGHYPLDDYQKPGVKSDAGLFSCPDNSMDR
jgi:hypothetical protein